MDSSVSGKDEIWFLRVCHHVPHEIYHKRTMFDTDDGSGTRFFVREVVVRS